MSGSSISVSILRPGWWAEPALLYATRIRLSIRPDRHDRHDGRQLKITTNIFLSFFFRFSNKPPAFFPTSKRSKNYLLDIMSKFLSVKYRTSIISMEIKPLKILLKPLKRENLGVGMYIHIDVIESSNIRLFCSTCLWPGLKFFLNIPNKILKRSWFKYRVVVDIFSELIVKLMWYFQPAAI